MAVTVFGLTFGDTGAAYVIPTYQAIRTAAGSRWRSLKNLPGMNLLPGSFFGDMLDFGVSILHAGAQAAADAVSKSIYNSASGTSLEQLLDPVTTRLPATSSIAQVYAYGSSGAAVPLGAIVRTSPTAPGFAFGAGFAIPLPAATEAWVFEIVNFEAGTASGTTFTLTVNGSPFAVAAGPGDSAADILADLIGQVNGAFLSQLAYDAGVRPDDSYIAGLVREESGGGPFLTTFTDGGAGFVQLWSAEVEQATASATGPTEAPAASLRFGALPASIEGYVNVEAAAVGRNEETDAQLRARHLVTQRRGFGNPDAIRAIMLTPVEQGGLGATYASVEYNPFGFTDAAGNVEHSVRLIIDADASVSLAGQLLFTYKAAGDNTNGAVGVFVTDAEGTVQVVRLDILETLYIWCDVEVTPGVGWPYNADPLAQLRADLVDFINALGGGKSVKPNDAPVSLLPDSTPRGVANFRLRFGYSTDPAGLVPPITYLDYWPDPEDDAAAATVPITGRQVAETSLARITAGIV